MFQVIQMLYPVANQPASPPDSPHQISPGIAFHLRKLLRMNLDRLTFDRLAEGCITLEQLSDLNAVMESVYPDPIQRSVAIRQLEQLAFQHQDLNCQGAKYRQERRKTEQEIFELLGFQLHELNYQATILTVDDTPANLRLLSAALSKHGYEVCSAINGPLALSTAKDVNPDLILLDIMMPEMDGYEVCQRLKADPETRDIPVMFISAVDETMDKVRALNIGGVDYVAKPFQIEEVLARIEHQLNIRNLLKRLESQNVRLQAEIQRRKQTEAKHQEILTKLQDLGIDIDKIIGLTELCEA